MQVMTFPRWAQSVAEWREKEHNRPLVNDDMRPTDFDRSEHAIFPTLTGAVWHIVRHSQNCSLALTDFEPAELLPLPNGYGPALGAFRFRVLPIKSGTLPLHPAAVVFFCQARTAMLHEAAGDRARAAYYAECAQLSAALVNSVRSLEIVESVAGLIESAAITWPEGRMWPCDVAAFLEANGLGTDEGGG